MRSVTIEKVQDAERFGAVIAFMERLKIIDSANHWKLIRERRNAVNHDCEDDGARLAEFFELTVGEASALVGYFTRSQAHCATPTHSAKARPRPTPMSPSSPASQASPAKAALT